MEQTTIDRISALLSREVKPALGCTEPIAVAIAVAKAVSIFPGAKLKKIDVKVSANILKNAMGVGIPGTGETGLPVAIALAAVCGNWQYGLEVLKDVTPEYVADAKRILKDGAVSVSVSDNSAMLYAEAECLFENGHKSKATVRDEHDKVVYVSKDDYVILDIEPSDMTESDYDNGSFLTLDMIYDYAKSVDLSQLELIRLQIELNSALSDEGLKGGYGLSVGRTLYDNDTFGSSLSTQCMALTAAASDARMSGCMLAALSNSGSGNQGITVSMPVIATAKYLKSTEEQLIRALTVSNLVAIHIKSYLGKLSALCGCVVASAGASCGIVMLKGYGVETMAYSLKNMIGSITGMLCDGAKEGCAMKVASGVSSALQSAILAMNGICAQPTDGIIDSDVEQTIRNLGNIGSKGMIQTDRMVLDIMVSGK